MPRTGGYADLGVAAWNQGKATRLNFYDTSRSLYAISSEPDCSAGEMDPDTVLCISAMAQGNGQSNRFGEEVIYKKVYVSGTVQFAAGYQGSPTNENVFIALVLDKQTNGAQLNSEDVFTNPGNTGALAAEPLRNLANSKRFRVLDTTRVQFGDVGYRSANDTWAGEQKHFDLNWKGTIKGNFTDSAAGIASVLDNSFHVIAYASDGTGAVLNLAYNARVRFIP